MEFGLKSRLCQIPSMIQNYDKTWNPTMFVNVKVQHVPKRQAVFFEVIIHLEHIFKWKMNEMLFVVCMPCSTSHRVCFILTQPELYAIKLSKKYFTDLCSKLTLVGGFGCTFRVFSTVSSWIIGVNCTRYTGRIPPPPN